jgi:hypothetical protein
MSKTEAMKTIINKKEENGRAIFLSDGSDSYTGYKILYHGKVYPSLVALERELSLKKGTLSYTMSKFRNWSDIGFIVEWCKENCKPYDYSSEPVKEKEKVNVDDLPPVDGCIPVTYKGVTYRSLRSAERLLGIKERYLGDVMRRYGYTVEEAIDRFFHPENFVEREYSAPVSAKPVSYKGVQYESRRACAEANDIDESLLSKRLNAGWSVEEAIETPKEVDINKGIPFNGVIYPNEKALCSAYNIGINSFHQRLKDGWPFDIALTYPLPRGKRKNPVYYDGKVYKSIMDFAKEVGLKYNLLIIELKKGKKIAECAKNPLLKLKDGEKFENFANKCDYVRQKMTMREQSLDYACNCSQFSSFEY